VTPRWSRVYAGDNSERRRRRTTWTSHFSPTTFLSRTGFAIT
jgi:hypothetical protein